MDGFLDGSFSPRIAGFRHNKVNCYWSFVVNLKHIWLFVNLTQQEFGSKAASLLKMTENGIGNFVTIEVLNEMSYSSEGEEFLDLRS